MAQDESWNNKYNEVMAFIEKEHRNPSKYDAEERGRYVNWMRHNKKVMNAGGMKEERRERFVELLKLCDQHKRKNQYK